MTGVKGTRFEFDLAEPVALRAGDLLLLNNGNLIEVVAEPEPLIEARAQDLTALARLAWHLGDRHVPVQLFANRLRVRRDAAIEALLARLGARIVTIEAPFDPEGGAYVAPAHGRHEPPRSVRPRCSAPSCGRGGAACHSRAGARRGAAAAVHVAVARR